MSTTDIAQQTRMTAIVYDQYGAADVLRQELIAKPVVGDDEVLVRVRAAGVNPADWHIMRGDPALARLAFGIGKPKKMMIIGSDIAGEVERIGRNVTRFRVGDQVYADAETGGCAEYVCIAEKHLAHKPVNLSFEQAAAVPLAALTALQGLRNRGRIEAGQYVLVNGASGGVGHFAVQLAKSFGAHVTGVCSTRNLEMVRSLGADRVIDYTQNDFTRGEHRYDLILDTPANHSLAAYRRALTPKGTLVLVGAGGGRLLGPAGQMLRALLLSPFVSQRLAPLRAVVDGADLELITALVEDGKVTPVIDRSYAMSETAAAMRHLEEGHVAGKLVITI